MTAEFSWYRYRFGENGNVSAVPDTAQGGGELSLQEGWGSDYDLDLATQSNAKAISRTQHNQLWQGITGNINFWQQNLYPLYTPAASNGGVAVAYPFGTRVRFDAGSGLNVYEVINASGTNSLPSSAANWVLVSAAYPRSGTAGSQQRTNSQNDSRFLIGGTAGTQIRNNTQNDARFGITGTAASQVRTNSQNEAYFQDTGDHVPSGNSAGMLARGFTLAGIPALARPVYTFSAFATLGTGYPGTIPLAVAVNSSNNDVFACDGGNDTVYKLTGGSGAWAAIGSYPGSLPGTIAVNPNNGDVFVGDLGGTLYRLPGGSGSFIVHGSYPESNIADMTINVSTGALWFVSSTSTPSDSAVYRMDSGTSVFTSVGRYPGLRPSRIGVDSITGTVYVADNVTDQIGTTNARDQIYVLQEGIGNFRPILAVQYTGEGVVGISVDPGNSDLWISGSSEGNNLRSPGGVDAFVAGGAPGNSFGGRIAVNGSNGTVIMADNNGNRIIASTRTEVTPAVEWYIQT